MPRLEISDFPGETEDEKRANCFAAFTERQRQRLAHLKDPKVPAPTGPPIYLSKPEYAMWVVWHPNNLAVHQAMEIALRADIASYRLANVKLS